MTRVVDTPQAAEYAGVSESYLKQARLAGSRIEGPPYLRFGRAVRYRITDLDAWCDRHLVTANTLADRACSTGGQ